MHLKDAIQVIINYSEVKSLGLWYRITAVQSPHDANDFTPGLQNVLPWNKTCTELRIPLYTKELEIFKCLHVQKINDS